jgi:H+/Cl- antiporter ClcA
MHFITLHAIGSWARVYPLLMLSFCFCHDFWLLSFSHWLANKGTVAAFAQHHDPRSRFHLLSRLVSLVNIVSPHLPC